MSSMCGWLFDNLVYLLILPDWMTFLFLIVSSPFNLPAIQILWNKNYRCSLSITKKKHSHTHVSDENTTSASSSYFHSYLHICFHISCKCNNNNIWIIYKWINWINHSILVEIIDVDPLTITRNLERERDTHTYWLKKLNLILLYPLQIKSFTIQHCSIFTLAMMLMPWKLFLFIQSNPKKIHSFISSY